LTDSLGRATSALIFLILTVGLVLHLAGLDWAGRAGLLFALGVFVFVMAVVELRKDESSGRFLLACAVGITAIAAAVWIAFLVVQSWAWVGLAIAVLIFLAASETWDRWGSEAASRLGGNIADDVDAKQERQDEQLGKTFFHG
jgi:hypothetical protein